MSPVFRLYRAAQYGRVFRQPGALRILSRFPKLELSVLEGGRDGKPVVIKGTDVDPTLPHSQFLLRGSNFVRRLTTEAGARFLPLPDGVLLEVDGVKLKLQDWEELLIAAEVFAEGIYNLQFQGDFVLLDVGMNVATTSLFFARQGNCQSVYAFELFPKTVAKAQVNLALNPQWVAKIQVEPSGLAARQYSSELDYFEEYKGSVGINGIPVYVTADPSSLRHEKVRVNFLAAADALTSIHAKHPGTPLVCKMDCEGAEYEILEDLASKKLLGLVRHFMIEWHSKGAAPLERLLVENGFSVLAFSPRSSSYGMIYAWQSSP